MTAPSTEAQGQTATRAARSAYSREAQRKLLTVRSHLTGVDAKLSNALSTGLLHRSVQLKKARRGVEEHLARAEQRLDALRKSDLNDWRVERDGVEHACEDLHRAIRYLVAHLSRVSDDSK